jgi:protein-disulfide isomerase
VADKPDERKSSDEEIGSARGSLGQANLGLYFLVSLVTAIAVVAVAAGINHAWPIFGETSGNQTVNVVAQGTPGAQPTAAPQATPKTVTIDVGDNPAKGPATAKVTVVEFSDFECPYCGNFATQTFGQIISNYGDKIRFVFLNLPLTQIHPYAEKAAEAAECANEQGAFWQYHDILFQNQATLTAFVTADATGGVAKVVDSMKGYAAQLGLDTAKFNDCLDSGRMASAVQADMTVAQTAATDAGLTRFGTPAFFINGNNLSGAQPYAVFKAAIDAALAAAQ